MSSILSIESARRSSIKQVIKAGIGRAMAVTMRRRADELFATPLSQPQRWRDRMIMTHLKEQAVRTSQVEFFERLHHDFWVGDGGAVFSKNCDHRFEDLFLDKQYADFEALRERWSASSLRHIVEFGCSSGRLLHYLATRLPNVISATGVEINAEQVRRNKANMTFDAKIRFQCADGSDWLLNHGQHDTLFVSNGGVLEYFRRERLNKMLTHIRERLSPSMYFVVEPVAPDHDWSLSADSIPFGDELSFSHNYVNLFKTNGFDIHHLRRVEYQSWQMVAIIASCG